MIYVAILISQEEHLMKRHYKNCHHQLENMEFSTYYSKKKVLKGYEIVAGERRVLASRMAGLDKIPAIVKEFF